MPDLSEQIAESVRAVAVMTPDEKAEMLRQQRASFVRGEAGLGSDADEAAWRKAMAEGDIEAIARLRAEEQARIAAADAWLKENGHA